MRPFLRIFLSILALCGAAQVAHADTTTLIDYNGYFASGNGLVRCSMFERSRSADGTAFVECQSMSTGRVVQMGRLGNTKMFPSSERIRQGSRGARTRIYSNSRSGLACQASIGDVLCIALKSHKSRDRTGAWMIDNWRGTIRRPGRTTFSSYSDAPPKPAPAVPSAPAPSPAYTTPGPYGPGSGYGQISPVTGLPRTTYVAPYVRSDGTFVRGYYRSCSRCA